MDENKKYLKPPPRSVFISKRFATLRTFQIKLQKHFPETNVRPPLNSWQNKKQKGTLHRLTNHRFCRLKSADYFQGGSWTRRRCHSIKYELSSDQLTQIILRKKKGMKYPALKRIYIYDSEIQLTTCDGAKTLVNNGITANLSWSSRRISEASTVVSCCKDTGPMLYRDYKQRYNRPLTLEG